MIRRTQIIADVGANHLGKDELIEAYIKEAAAIGIDILKFQSWQADKLRKDYPNYEQEYQYYKNHELSDEQHQMIVKLCKRNGVIPLFTVFDLERVEFIESLGIEMVKIASPDCNSLRLLGECLDKFKTVIISTGMHTWKEIDKLMVYIRRHSTVAMYRTILMHCVSQYPTEANQVNLEGIECFKESGHAFGYSDHTVGVEACMTAIALHCHYVEKHYTLSKYLNSKDALMSGTREDFVKLVEFRDKIEPMRVANRIIDEAQRQKFIGRWGNNK